ncbi:Uncharacterised protein [uncultured archaeon]|nr:Uncharacterised protein [uncultured archaeon]
MTETYNNHYFKRLAEIVSTAPKLKNSYLYITKVKENNPAEKVSLLEKKI